MTRIFNIEQKMLFNAFQHVVPNHIIIDDLDQFPAPLKKYSDDLEGRSLLVKKAKRNHHKAAQPLKIIEFF
jgi:phosphoribosylaminoimidazole-succinocarboxamide synthase